MSTIFYMVWNPARATPRVQHPNEFAARNEAERLARLQPGDKFYVLAAVSVSSVPVITTRLEEEPLF